MKDQVFGVLQRIGRSFMLPIALLPRGGTIAWYRRFLLEYHDA